MGRKLLVSCLIALIACSGCIPSLNPVYREDDLVTDSAFLGVWMQKGEKSRWEFSKRDEKSYSLKYFDVNGTESRFVAHVAKIEGELFLDLFPEPLDGQANSFYTFHHVPIHSIYRVCRTEPTLELGAIDFQWLQEELSKAPATIESTTIHGRWLITAPTEQVRAFALNNKERFTGKFELVRAVAPFPTER